MMTCNTMSIHRIECTSAVESQQWDELAAGLGGSFFHCYAHAAYESRRPNVEPYFVKAFDGQKECVGVAVGTISSPRYWPFSQFCRVASFAALPATRNGTAKSERTILQALERELRRKGIFRIEVGSCESKNSVEVLSALGYDLKSRAEFYMDLRAAAGDIWKSFSKECRNTIRKAMKAGMESRRERGVPNVFRLQELQAEAMRRHGVEIQPHEGNAAAIKEILLDKGRGILFMGYYAESAVCASLCSVFSRKAYYAASGSSELGRKNAGPAFLIWKMIESLKADGVERLNLGGAPNPDDNDTRAYGLYRFKRDFGATAVVQPAGSKIISPAGSLLNALLRMSKTALKSGQNIPSLVTRKTHSFFRYFYRVPWCVPPWGWREFGISVRHVVAGSVTEGNCPQHFADAVRNQLGVRYALPVNRGRAAIELALRALDLSESDDVLVPSYVCHAVLDAILRVGVHPLFADVGPDLQITPEAVKAALTTNTKCVIVPHLFGNAARIDEIEKILSGTGIHLIDDAAQSFGAQRAGRPVGSFGTCGIVSCGPGKPLAGPAGGLLLTNNRELYERAAAIAVDREHWTTVARRVSSFWIWRRFRGLTLPLAVLLERLFKIEVDQEDGYVSSTMSNLEAALALEQFWKFRSNVERRKLHCGVFLRALSKWSNCRISSLSADSPVVRLVLLLPAEGPDADCFITAMAKDGIECQRGYTPLHLDFGRVRGSLPVTERLWQHVVCIPIDLDLKTSEKTRLLPSNDSTGSLLDKAGELPRKGLTYSDESINGSQTGR